MSDMLQLNKATTITLADDEFGNGFQIGYLCYKKDVQGKPVTDTLIYNVIAQNIMNVCRKDHCNAGYVVGWIAGMLEVSLERE